MKRKNVIKNRLMAAMTASMLISLAACGKDVSNTSSTSTNISLSAETVSESVADVTSEKEADKGDMYDWPYIVIEGGAHHIKEVYNKCEDLTDWGQYGTIWDKGTHIYRVKFPKYAPNSNAKELTENQNHLDDYPVIAMFVPIYTEDESLSEEYADIENILPAAIENDKYSNPAKQIIKCFGSASGYFDLDLYAVNVSVDSTKLETVGQYDCAKFTGVFNCQDPHYVENPQDHTYSYVAYASYSKMTGRAFYLMLVDMSEDQSMREKIADHAKKMGYTIIEDNR